MAALTSILEGSPSMHPVLAILVSAIPVLEELHDDVPDITGARAGEGLARETTGGSPEVIVRS